MDSSNELGSQTASESPAGQASRIGVDIGNKLPSKPQVTPDSGSAAPAPEQVSNDQLNNFAELSGDFNPQTGENSISYVALQQARALGLNPSPRALNALTNYVQSHDAHVRQMIGQAAPAPTKLPVGYKVYRPSDDQVRELMRIMGENN